MFCQELLVIYSDESFQVFVLTSEVTITIWRLICCEFVGMSFVRFSSRLKDCLERVWPLLECAETTISIHMVCIIEWMLSYVPTVEVVMEKSGTQGVWKHGLSVPDDMKWYIVFTTENVEMLSKMDETIAHLLHVSINFVLFFLIPTISSFNILPISTK